MHCVMHSLYTVKVQLTYKIKSADEAQSVVHQCKVMLNEITADIRNSTGISGTLNGPEGHVSATTVNSVEITRLQIY